MTGGSVGTVYLAYAVVLVTAVASSARRGVPRTGRRPTATPVALVVVGVPSLLQLTVAPGLLDALRRDRAAEAGGQLWRLGTAVVVQDGGWVGTVFNLVSRWLVGAAAERAWGTRRWLVLAVAAGLGGELWGLLVQPVGAGNSVVVFGLAASLAVLSVRCGPRPARLLGALSAAVSAVLLATGDLHGGPAAVGAVLGLVLSRDRAAGYRPGTGGAAPDRPAPGRPDWAGPGVSGTRPD